MLETKICGLTTLETVDAAIRHGATHVGFVFYASSPRNLDFDRADQLAARVPVHVAKVGVFVDPDDALIERAIDAAGLDVLQLHDTAPARASALSRHSRDLWGVVAVRTRADLDTGSNWRGVAQRLLYDAKTPPGQLPGGMGVRFDWSLLADHRPPLPWGLSGGLDPANLVEAIGITHAPLVDVSSGVESAPGVKDVDKIAAFLGEARKFS